MLAFPSNDFGGQEPGTHAEIQRFCETEYHTQFALFSKVRAGKADTSPLYDFLTRQTEPALRGDVKWNFTKFLVNRKGRVVARFEPRTAPNDKAVIAAITKALAER